MRDATGEFDRLVRENEILRLRVAELEGEAERSGSAVPIDMQRAQRELLESERQYRTLVESLPHLVWTCRADGSCDYLSPRWVDYTGIPEADQLGYRWLEQLHPDDRERVIAEWAEVAPRGGGFDIEFRIRRADGAYRWFKTRAIPFRDDGGRVVKWFGSNTDIDDHKQVHEALRESEEKYRGLFDNAEVGMYRSRLDGSGFLDVNQRYADLFGFTKEEMTVRPPTLCWADRNARDEMIRLLHECGDLRDYEIDIVTKDGEVRTTLASIKLYPREGYLEGSVVDITERRRAQQEIESLARFPGENPNPVLRVRHDGKIIYANAGSEDLLVGWSCAVGDWLPSNLRDRITKSVAENASAIVEVTSQNRVFSLLFTPIPGNDYVNLYGEEVTERVRAEEAVRESEERNRTTLQSLGDAVIATDGSGRITQMNPVAETLTGWLEAAARDQPLASVFRIVNEETRAPVESPVSLVLRKGQVVGLANHTVLIAKDGKERPIADSGAPIRNATGSTTGVVLVFRDQTEERAVQRALAEREAQFRATFEQAAVGIAHVGLDGAWLRVNQRLCDIVGYTSDDLLQRTFQDVTHPDDLDTDLKYVQQILAGEIQIYSLAKRYLRKDRSQVWINLTVSLVRDDNGAPKYFVSVVEDISTRKQAEDALLEQYAISARDSCRAPTPLSFRSIASTATQRSTTPMPPR
jgi:PAS domain S-box-containing protein